jgi:hypothetical protein
VISGGIFSPFCAGFYCLAVAELLLFAFVPVLDGAEEADHAGVGFYRGCAFGVLLFFRHL